MEGNYIFAFLQITRKNLPLIEVGLTTLAWPITLTLTYDLDLQSPASYGRDLLTRKSSSSTVSQFKR